MSNKNRPSTKQDPPSGKTIRAGASPSGQKSVRFGGDAGSSNGEPPVWITGLFDVHGPWGREGISIESLWGEILPKIKNFESMTWADIERDRESNHSVAISKMIKEARVRIEELKLDVDELFRFRLTGKQRLWGIRDRNTFKILWWDPGHQVCPSVLKHT